MEAFKEEPLSLGFGEVGRTAEAVGTVLAQDVRRYLAAGVPVDPHLADQLVVPMALAGAGAFRTLPPSRHTLGNLELVRRFLGIAAEARRVDGATWEVSFGPAAAPEEA